MSAYGPYLSHDGLNAQDVPLYLEEALIKKEKGLQYPFIIIDSASGKIIGTSRFWKMNEANKKLEIGWTCLHPDYWSGGYNLAGDQGAFKQPALIPFQSSLTRKSIKAS